MAERRIATDQSRTMFFGLSLVPTDADRVHRGADVCEEFHDERGCHLGYTKQALSETGTDAWTIPALEHMKVCQRRRTALGIT